MSDFDVCVIGAGPAGYAAAMRCHDYGKKVLIVDKGPLGGTGVHNGALSSKTLWELSRDYQKAMVRDRGFIAQNVTLDFGEVMNCVAQALDEKVDQLRYQLQELSQPRQDQPGCVTWLQGSARFLDPHRIVIEGGPHGDRIVTATSFVVATGSKPATVDAWPVDGRRVMTSDHLSGFRRFPRSLVVVGAGVVGCEFATIFANFGQTKVFLVDRAERILPFEDEDVSRVCSRNLERKGVTIHHRAQLVSLNVEGNEVVYTIEHHTGGRETIRVDHALISIGRTPNTAGLDLEKAGVKLGPRGHIDDDDTRTSAPHIHAAGDVTQDLALVSVGEMEGRHAAEQICADSKDRMSFDNISSIYFLDPEVAGCGMSEQDAQKKRIPYRVAVYGYELVNRAIAMRATSGFLKLLVTDDDEMKILGMRALGVHASTTIAEVSLVMRHNRSVRDIAELLHPHPAVTEGVQDCVRMLLGTSIHKPHVFKNALRLSRVTYAEDGSLEERTLRKDARKKGA
jgi:dihydrolipoamide dehydrogenase